MRGPGGSGSGRGGGRSSGRISRRGRGVTGASLVQTSCQMARCPLVSRLLHPSLACRAEQLGIPSRVWLELGERALEQTRVGASSPQSPSQCVESRNHNVVRVGRDLSDHPVAPPCRGQEHTLRMSHLGDNCSVPVQVCRSSRGTHGTGEWKKQGMDGGCGHSLA